MHMNVNKKDRPKLTRTTIVAAAVKIADKDGIDLVSMRKVANKLGVEAMSLYHHVSNKDALIAGMVEYVAPEIDPPIKGNDWKEALRNRAHTIKDVLEAHTWSGQLFLSKINDGPRMMKFNDATIGYFIEADFTTAQTDYAWNLIDSYIYGFNLQGHNFPIQPSEYKKIATQYLPYISQNDLPYIYRMTESIVDGSNDGVQDFDFGLDLILDGIEKKYSN